MRLPLALSLVVATAFAGAGVVATSSDAEAQSRRDRDRRPVVTIQPTPRWLTLGTQVPLGERRGAGPFADARLASTGRDIPGIETGGSWLGDPWYLPRPHTTIEFDWPLGRKLAGER